MRQGGFVEDFSERLFLTRRDLDRERWLRQAAERALRTGDVASWVQRRRQLLRVIAEEANLGPYRLWKREGQRVYVLTTEGFGFFGQAWAMSPAPRASEGAELNAADYPRAFWGGPTVRLPYQEPYYALPAYVSTYAALDLNLDRIPNPVLWEAEADVLAQLDRQGLFACSRVKIVRRVRAPVEFLPDLSCRR